jgi:hypothetical protein
MLDEVACTASADDGVLSLGLRARTPLAAVVRDKMLAGRPSRVKNIEQIVAAPRRHLHRHCILSLSRRLDGEVQKGEITQQTIIYPHNLPVSSWMGV